MALASTTALVTGADSDGIGRAIALMLARGGTDVALHWYRSRDKAEELAGMIADLGRRAVLVEADMGDPAQARAAVRKADEALGDLGILVCNAAKIQRKAFLEITDAQACPTEQMTSGEETLPVEHTLSPAHNRVFGEHNLAHIGIGADKGLCIVSAVGIQNVNATGRHETVIVQSGSGGQEPV